MVERQMTPGSPVNQGKALSLPALPSFPNKEQNQLNHHHYYSSLSSASKSTPQLGKTSTAKKRFLSGIARITNPPPSPRPQFRQVGPLFYVKNEDLRVGGYPPPLNGQNPLKRF